MVDALPKAAWTGVRLVRSSLDRASTTLRFSWRFLLGVAARYDKRARRALIDRARQDYLGALSSLGDISKLSSVVAKAQIEKLAGAVRRQASDSRRGRFDIG